MTVATIACIITYTGDGVSTAFPTAFKFFAAADLVVTRVTISDGARVVLIEGVDYTVAGAGVDAGGTVTTIGAGSPLSALYQLEIRRSTAMLQPLNLVANDSMPAEDVERELDRVTMNVQELAQQLAAVVAGGSGAFTISNRPGSGAGWYSQQIANDFQFKKFRTTNDFGITDNADEIVLRMAGAISHLNRASAAPLIIDDSSSFALSWRQASGPTGSRSITTLLIPEDLTVDKVALKFIGAGDDGIADGGVILDLTHNNDANDTTVVRAMLYGHNAEFDQGNISGTPTIDLNRGGRQKATLTGNVTALTVTAPYNNLPAHGHFDFIQDGTGSRTIVWPSAFKWPSARTAGDKALSTAAGSRDRLVWDYNGTDYLVDLIKGRV
jgi:hypothetical protein